MEAELASKSLSFLERADKIKFAGDQVSLDQAIKDQHLVLDLCETLSKISQAETVTEASATPLVEVREND